MRNRRLTFCALMSLAFFAACDDGESITSANPTTATVRFVNATSNTNISVANNGTVGAGNSALPFGSGSSCMTANTTSPNLTFTNSTTGTAIPFTSSFAANGNYTVVAYTDAAGNTQFTTLDNAFTPATNQSGLRSFNAASGSGNVVLNAAGTPLNGGAATAFPNAGAFFSTPAGTATYTFNTGTGTTTLATVTGQTLTAGQNSTAILGPGATGTAARRAFFTTGC